VPCGLFIQQLPAKGDRAGGVTDLTSRDGINIVGPLNHQGIDQQRKRAGQADSQRKCRRAVMQLKIWGSHRISRFSCSPQQLERSLPAQKPGILDRLFPSRGAA